MTESAIYRSLEQLTRFWNGDVERGAALNKSLEQTAQRLDATGGVWAGSDLAPVPPAPATVAGLAAYMYESAVDQLAALAADGTLDPADRVTLAGLAAGRLAHSLRLVEAFAPEQPMLGLAALPTYTVGAAADEESGGPQYGVGDDMGEQSLLTYDCLYQAVIGEGVVGVPERLALANMIQDRTTELTLVGTSGARPARCNARPLDAAGLTRQMMVADLGLFASSSEAVRELGARWLVADTRTSTVLAPWSVEGVTMLETLEGSAQSGG